MEKLIGRLQPTTTADTAVLLATVTGTSDVDAIVGAMDTNNSILDITMLPFTTFKCCRTVLTWN